MYSNFEDVKVPVKNIDEVAPIENNPVIFKNSICTICQEVVKEPVRKTLCNHLFCSNCIEPWLKEMNKTCPNCLCDLEELKAKK
jgi:formylmethanofuran dehydrogenase subunit E